VGVVGAGPAEGHVGVAFGGEDGAVEGDEVGEGEGLVAFDGDPFRLARGLAGLALVGVDAGAEVDLFGVEVHVVELEGGDAPGDAVVVADGDGGDAGEGGAG